MHLNELFENRSPLNEWGTRGFGGYGQKIFTRGHLIDLANICANLPGAVKGKIVQWFCDILQKDNPNFKPATFAKAAEIGQRNNANTRWQKRQYYYLAECIKAIPSENMKVFIVNLLADFFERYRDPYHYEGNFLRSRWYTFCGIDDPDAEPEPVKIGGRNRPAAAKPRGDEQPLLPAE